MAYLESREKSRSQHETVESVFKSYKDDQQHEIYFGGTVPRPIWRYNLRENTINKDTVPIDTGRQWDTTGPVDDPHLCSLDEKLNKIPYRYSTRAGYRP